MSARFSLIAALVAAASLPAGLGVAHAGDSSRPARAAAPPEANPCLVPHKVKLRCPDIQMGIPADMYVERTPRGRVLLRATNNVKSRGKGPVVLRGRRTGRYEMSARQHIYRANGTQLVERTGATLHWQPIPGQGHYWKMRDAARFELWSVDPTGHRLELVRTGPKVYYCLRDLYRTKPGKRAPRSAVFPGCSQDPSKRRVTLGTSTGWSDIYPSTYHQQWIDVTGLRGCFAYVHRADPENRIFESNEGNNDSQRIIRLPWGSRRKCPTGGSGPTQPPAPAPPPSAQGVPYAY